MHSRIILLLAEIVHRVSNLSPMSLNINLITLFELFPSSHAMFKYIEEQPKIYQGNSRLETFN